MSYADFCTKVSALCAASGVSVRFSHTDGKHIARVSDGYTITGNDISRRVSIRNHNHSYAAVL